MKIKKGIVINDLGDSYTAYDLDRSVLHELNQSAYMILEGISEQKTKEEIVDRISNHFEIPVEKARADYDHFLKMLKSIEVIE